jgi:hypothetical protein
VLFSLCGACVADAKSLVVAVTSVVHTVLVARVDSHAPSSCVAGEKKKGVVGGQVFSGGWDVQRDFSC